MRRALGWAFHGALLLAAGYYIAYFGELLGVLPPAFARLPLLYRGPVAAALMLAVILPAAFVVACAITWHIMREAAP